jgi:hypothetical protein
LEREQPIYQGKDRDMPIFLKQLIVTVVLFVDISALLWTLGSPNHSAIIALVGVWAISALIIAALFRVRVRARANADHF